MSRPPINPGRLVWSGEHWICFLRPEGSDADSALISLYETRWSPAGEGRVAFVHLPGQGFTAACCDDEALQRFLYETFVAPSRSPINRPDLAPRRARIQRAGDVRREPSWVIEVDEGPRIVATWSRLQPPIYAETPAPVLRDDADLSAVLVFADEARVEVDGQPVDGAVYQRDIWQRSIGGLRSSCVFAISETFVTLA